MKIFIAVVVIVLGGLFYLNPTIDDHIAAISSKLPDTVDEGDEENSIWNDISYSNFYVFSGTKSVENGTMISFGAAKYVIIVDDEWPYI